MDSSLNISFFLKFDLFDVSSVDSFISFFFFVEEIDSLLSGFEFFFLSSRSDGNDLDYFLYQSDSEEYKLKSRIGGKQKLKKRRFGSYNIFIGDRKDRKRD